MLSYQHIYHAGNPADVHKHALLAAMLDYLTAKDKPISYIETHAGRGLYDLGDPAALKTGEAAAGVASLLNRFPADHPYVRAVGAVRARRGASAYPGSPLIAQHLLRPTDRLHLAELHPQEYRALAQAARAPNLRTHRAEGLALAQSLCPPDPRRGLLMIDPSYEVKTDYARMPGVLKALKTKWNVGVLVLWYPILTSGAERDMVRRLTRDFPDAFRHEQRFAPVRDGHRMVGSGMFVMNPPFGTDKAAAAIEKVFGPG